MNRTALIALAALVLVACDGGSGGSETKVFFGDLHAHSAFSAPDRVGEATPEDFYHDSFLTPEEWDVTRATAPTFDDPGTFVAFSAIEWTHQWHMNTIFRRDDEEICDCPEGAQYYDHHRGIIEARDAAGHLNHPTDIFLPNWSEIDDTLSKNVEVFNASSSDQERGYGGAIWSLRAGFRFGFVGVSDDHMTDAMPPRIGNGITGCHADALTRESILDALHERRCYATTRERILVDTEIAGAVMGGVASAEIGATVPARVTVTATAAPIEVELVVNGEPTATEICDEVECVLDTSVRIEEPNNFVYARVFQAEGQRAWSSPVWVGGVCPSGDRNCLLDRLAAGGGTASSDCLSEFLYPADGSVESYALDPAAIRCRDGDPGCDLDDVAGECSVRVGLCFEVDDPRLAQCAPEALDGFEVIEPGPDAPRLSPDWQNRSTLGAIFRAAHTSTDKNRCSGVSGLRVAAGEQRIFRVVTHAGDRSDEDVLTVECLAEAG
jgi:hypothetical protein